MAARVPGRVLSLALVLSLATQVEARESDGIVLRSGEIDTSITISELAGPDHAIRLVQFPGPVTAQQLDSLTAAVERVYTYLPDHAFLVRLSDGEGDHTTLAALGASWQGAYRSHYKISPEISAAGGDDPTLRPVLLHLFPDTDLEASRAAVESIIGKPVVATVVKQRFSRARLLLSAAEIATVRDALAELRSVYWLELERRKVFKNDSTAWVGQSGTSGGQATPVFNHGILGEGQIVAVLDTGVDIDSCYFRDSNATPLNLPAMNECNVGDPNPTVDLTQRKVIAVDFLWDNECVGGISNFEWDTQGHGTHVAGTVAGDDISQPGVHNARDGMAPAAKLVIQDCGFQTDNCADCPGIGCSVVDLNPIFQQAFDQGARIHTNSWGDEENEPNVGEYTAGSEDADEFMWNHPEFLLLFAAGNNGGTVNTVDSPSTAKSVISVGSTLRGAGADSISGFSSRGPTDDGRIKPDLTNPGSSIESASNDSNIGTSNCNNNQSSGTSMATPGVAGFAALVRQYYQDGFYPTGAANAPDGFTPSASLIKASLINSATQMTNEGDIPNNTQGWGRVLLDESLYFSSDDRRLWVEDETTGFANGSTGDSFTYDLVVTGGVEPIEVTLAWTDFPSTPAAATNLVNDLDLELSGSDGTFLGNNMSGGVSMLGGSPDRLNNVEVVRIENPTAGPWTLTVRSFNVPGGPQAFSVVVTGAVDECAGSGESMAVAQSESFAPTGGDADLYLDNCEAGRMSFAVANLGNTAATNARVVSVTSPSHPGVLFDAASWSVPSIAGCAVDTTGYVDILQANGLASGNTLSIEVTVTNDELSPATQTTQFEIPATEIDFSPVASQVYDFETDLAGWTVESGTFNRDDSLGAPSGSWYLQSSAALANQCDVITSPMLELTATSTLSLWSSYDIEGGTPWYDRANISVIDGATSTVVAPDGGRLYDVPNGSANGPCATNNEAGWAGTNAAFATSSFSATALDASGLAGRPVRLDVRYGTDGGLELGGFRFDGVELTDILIEGPDAQDDVCIDSAIFVDGFESGDTTGWSSATP